MSSEERKTSGFKSRTPLASARETVLSAVDAHERTARLTFELAAGRVAAEPITASQPVPNYRRAAMDGFAVRAADTVGAADRSPVVLSIHEESVPPGGTTRVHTGSEMPAEADAVVPIEHATVVEDELEVFTAAAAGEHVGPVGEDVSEGQQLFAPGHRLRPSDLGLLKSVGQYEIEVYDRPTVGIIPTGEELVETDPEPGEIIETNGLTVSQLVEQWGGTPTYRNIVTDDESALRAAIQRDLTKDIVVTTGGSSVGERDLLPEVVDELGEILCHGVAIKPGYPVAIGRVQQTPICMLPGYPVSCIVTAVQLLRPLLKQMGRLPLEPLPSQSATLTQKLPSEPGSKTFARVKTETESGQLLATPVQTTGAGILSSVALADGWVVVPEPREGYSEGETVAVENWEAQP